MAALFEGNALLFTVPAIVGTLFFLLRMGVMLLGGDADADVDVVTEVDLDGAAVGDSTGAFELISVQTIAGFVMGFGWAGMIGFVSLEWGVLASLALGAGGGLAMMYLLAWMFRLIYSLQSDGNVSIDMAIGLEGSVYAQIPARGEGRGQVKLVVSQRSRIYTAVSEEEAISSHTRVRVVKVNDDNTLTVTPT